MQKPGTNGRLALVAAVSLTFVATPFGLAVSDGGWAIEPARAMAGDRRGNEGDDHRDDDDREDHRSDRAGTDDDGDDRDRGTDRDHDDGAGRADDGSNGRATPSDTGGRNGGESDGFERGDDFGGTVVNRAATAPDHAAPGLPMPSAGRATATDAAEPGADMPARIRVGQVDTARIEGGRVEVTYSRGWKEAVENGRYELKDPANRTVVERPATTADLARLAALAN